MRRKDLIFLTSAVVLVVAAVAFGFWTLGSPLRQREAAWDAKRAADLRAIAAEIRAYWTRKDEIQKRALPDSLHALASAPGAQPLSVRDPTTGQPYVYRRREGSAYELCATFAHASTDYQSETKAPPPSFWVHQGGQRCFVLDAARDAPR